MPRGHCVHDPPETETLPAGQLMHDVLPTPEYVPAGHFVQLEGPPPEASLVFTTEKVLAGQLVQLEAPSPENLPAGQELHDVALPPVENLPAGHLRHDLKPKNWPGGQLISKLRARYFLPLSIKVKAPRGS